MIVGACAAAWAGPLAPGWLVLTVLGVFCLEAAKNASGEIFDWDSGTDQAITEDERTPFSGGKRVLVDELLTRRQTAVIALVCYALGGAVGLAIVFEREPAVLWVGLLGMALAYFYHAPPLKLSYRGLGELAVAVSYGPLIAAGTYLVQRNAIAPEVVLAAVPLGIVIAGFLWINEFPDARADRLAGKRTLVVRLGPDRAASVFGIVIAVAYAGVVLLPLAGLPRACWLGLAGLPHGIAAARRLRRHFEIPQEIVPAQAWTLVSFLLLALGVGAGFVVSSLA